MQVHLHAGSDLRPPGWRTNPSDWPQRVPIAALALVGAGIATYLALFQYNVVASVWEPFFGDGSRIVLTSGLSYALPVSDAALGAISYILDAVTGVIGGRDRWRTMPWIVIVFGIAVGPLGAISVLLVIAQPVLYDSYCTLCLASAVVSLAMIGPAMDEVLAAGQFIRREQRAGHSTWQAFLGRSPGAAAARRDAA